MNNISCDRSGSGLRNIVDGCAGHTLPSIQPGLAVGNGGGRKAGGGDVNAGGGGVHDVSGVPESRIVL